MVAGAPSLTLAAARDLLFVDGEIDSKNPVFREFAAVLSERNILSDHVHADFTRRT